MEFRHLRCFVAVAEELHFARAAERLHIEQSPLSRTIKELEGELGALLFTRTARGTRLTQAGTRFLEHVPRVFAALEQARASVKDVTAGYQGELRIALSDGLTPARLSALMALCREEDPDIAIHCSEVVLSQQITGLHEGLYDLGFAQSADVGDGILATPAWHDLVHVILPARHPLLALSRITLREVLQYPLVLGDPRHCAGYCRQIEHLLRRVDVLPQVAERVRSVDLMMTLVSAGFAAALVGASQIVRNRELGLVARPLAEQMVLTTWFLRPATEPLDTVARFIRRVESLCRPADSRTEP